MDIWPRKNFVPLFPKLTSGASTMDQDFADRVVKELGGGDMDQDHATVMNAAGVIERKPISAEAKKLMFA